MSTREQKKAETERAIADAALALFAARGFDATTVDEIAEAAGVSRRTFFRYYETKEAALFANQADRLAHFRALLREASGPPLARVRWALLQMAELYMAMGEKVVAQNRIIESSSSLKAYDQTFDAQWEEAIFEALATGEADEARREQARWIAGSLVGLIRVVLRQWVAAGGQGDLVEIGRRGFQFINFGGDWT